MRVKAQEKYGKGANCKEKVKQKKSAGKEENCKICVKRREKSGKDSVKRQQEAGKTAAGGRINGRAEISSTRQVASEGKRQEAPEGKTTTADGNRRQRDDRERRPSSGGGK